MTAAAPATMAAIEAIGTVSTLRLQKIKKGGGVILRLPSHLRPAGSGSAGPVFAIPFAGISLAVVVQPRPVPTEELLNAIR